MMETLGLIRVRLHNLELLHNSGGCIVIANHPTLIDVVILLAHLPRANCVVKGELWRHRFIGGVMRGAGFISNERGDELLAGCQSALNNDEAILIFPEGSRTVPGRSEEHTSELQSRGHIVCRLLLDKKNRVSRRPSVRAARRSERSQSAS